MLFMGGVSDALGRKSVMVVSLLSSALLVLLSSQVHSWPLLLGLRMLLGLTLSGVPVVAMTYLAEEVHPESIGLGMGLYISGNAVGGIARQGCLDEKVVVHQALKAGSFRIPV